MELGSSGSGVVVDTVGIAQVLDQMGGDAMSREVEKKLTARSQAVNILKGACSCINPKSLNFPKATTYPVILQTRRGNYS